MRADPSGGDRRLTYVPVFVDGEAGRHPVQRADVVRGESRRVEGEEGRDDMVGSWSRKRD
jgi:hypothetical protein